MEYIVNRVSEEALLEQLIEECGELVQASAKRLRIIRGENPTPITLDDNIKNMVEELADVSLCARAAISKLNIRARVLIKQDEKLDRWHNRINEAEEEKRN